ncbi:unnamed protein product [Lymnaea stagnalis]|uniref:Coiled-coil domain-containing protein 83 n=1 Tax=Lymnaea stagnalis TaxID=6523 RepID=A0AAV2HZM7_LYMST
MAGKKGKGKKGKKGKKKGKGKKGRKSKEPQMTAQEAILAYQINVVEKKLEDLSYEIRGWEEKKRRNIERNEKLKREQDLLFQHLLKTNRDMADLFSGDGMKTRDDVTQEMMLKWHRQKEREKEMEKLKSQLALKEGEISNVVKEVKFWKSFRDSGQHKLHMQIKLLEQEIQDIESSFVDMEGHLSKENELAIHELEKLTEEALAQQKDKASERALTQLDKNDRQEIMDNEWLKREVAMHQVETDGIRQVVEMLERENLQLMSELFECSVEDLKVSRSFYLTQIDDSENLENNGILEMDLSQISPLPDEIIDDQVDKPIAAGRPKSATQKAVEDKVFSIIARQASLVDTQEDFEDENESDEQCGVYDNYYFEEEDFEDYLKLGPLELKLLSITGAPKPIHRAPALTEEELEAKQYKPDEWPVTTAMLKGPLLPTASNT